MINVSRNVLIPDREVTSAVSRVHYKESNDWFLLKTELWLNDMLYFNRIREIVKFSKERINER